MRFKDKVVIVTGGGDGIGAEVCLGFAQEGARVIAADIESDKVSALAEQIVGKGLTCFPLQMDVTKSSEAKRMVDETMQQFGGIDILVNCAGVRARNDLFSISEEEWDWVMAVNTKGTFLCGQAVASQMVKDGTKGRIINIGSIASFVAITNLLSYMASKGAVAMITRAMALELAEHGINVNAVAPGPVETAMTRDRMEDPKQLEEWIADNIPLARMAKPVEIYKGISFLASDDASFITGEILMMDGGWTIK